MTITDRIGIVVLPVLIGVSPPATAWAGQAPEAPPLVALQAGAETRPAGEDTWSRSFKAGPHGTLELWNLAGNVTIVGGAGDTIHVKAVKRLHRGSRNDLDRIEILATETAGRVNIRTSFGTSPEMKRVAAEVDFDIQVPAGSTVTVQTISGDIHLQKVAGTTTLESVSGDVVAVAAQRLIRAKTVSGDVRLDDIAGDALEANSVSGDIELRGLKAKGCTLQTVSGSISVEGVGCERAEMKSVSGNVGYSGGLVPGGRYDFKSHSGDILLTLSGKTGFSVSASTFSGGLRSQLPLTNVTTNEPVRHGPRTQRLQGTFGDGSARVEATTFSGSVVLASR